MAALSRDTTAIFRVPASAFRSATSLRNTSGGGPSIDSKATVELGETALARLMRPFDDGNDEQPAALAARAATASMPVR